MIASVAPPTYQHAGAGAGAVPATAPRLILASAFAPASMSPFRLGNAGDAARSRALDCLTTAVYYEARGEGSDGMAAVAQVVLNRVRHPLFPKSVCGVVFQGCQFSFACGGMNGQRNVALWSRSREIAEAALAGEVMSRVGTATFFHATRINPRWTGLRQVATVGRHVFYAYAGRRGAPSTFVQVADAGAAPAPAPRPERPVYAMLPSERPSAPAPAILPPPTEPAVEATTDEMTETTAEPAAAAEGSGPTLLPSVPVAPNPLGVSTPVA